MRTSHRRIIAGAVALAALLGAGLALTVGAPKPGRRGCSPAGGHQAPSLPHRLTR
jgi:hypothetical protein